MKAIIPAAGKGTRLRPHTLHTPKILLPIAGKPVLDYCIEMLLDVGCDEIGLIVGFQKEQLAEYTTQRYPEKIRLFEQTTPKGIAHAIAQAEDFLQDDPVIILLGDTLVDVNLQPVVDAHTTSLGVLEVADPSAMGIVEFGADGFVQSLVEKPENPQTNLALVGIYYVHEGTALRHAIHHIIHKDITTKGEYQITDAFQEMIRMGYQMTTFPVTNWYDTGTQENLLATNQIFMDRFIDPRQYEYPNSLIIPPVLIDTSTTISDSIIGPYVTLEGHCTVSNSIVRNSIISHHVTVHNSICSDSLIGEHTILQGTTKQINLGQYSSLKTET